MHERQFAAAVLPEPPRLFRLKLRPYSLGHELHLFRRNNPFLTESFDEFSGRPRGQRLAATMQAINVCAQGFASASKPSGRFAWWLWQQIAQWCDLKVTAERLRAYLIEGRHGFKSELPTREGLTVHYLGSPEILRLYQFVCDNVPEREIAVYSDRKRVTAWDYPFALATMLWQSRSEMAGTLEIWSVRNEIEAARMAELDAAEAAAKAAGKEFCQTP